MDGPYFKLFPISVCEDADFESQCWNEYGLIGFCMRLKNEERDTISSINTKDNCIQIFDGVDCQGNQKTLMPGSPWHSNLQEIGFNDRMKSWKVCSFDSGVSSQSLYPQGSEYAFWVEYFSYFEFSEQFKAEVRDQGRFIGWDFLGQRLEAQSKSDRYMELLWQVIDRSWDCLTCNQLDSLYWKAKQVADDRTTDFYRYPTDWNSQNYLMHRVMVDLWVKIKFALSKKYSEDCKDELSIGNVVRHVLGSGFGAG